MKFHSLGSALGLAIVLATGFGNPAAHAQAPVVPTQAARPEGTSALVPLRLVIEIQRYEGEKRVSSHPYTVWVTANDGQTTRLNAGQQIPIQTSVITPGSAVAPARSVTYQNVGTVITARATQTDNGPYRVTLSVEDSSVLPSKDADGFVTLNSLQTTNQLLLENGQRADFLAASDKVTGEITRISVTATVLK